ncbi:prevent-host-death protein [Nocardiopsis synnemataformans]|uniref:prevent-host-death protein n=1 Tax=Nocardiopsis synnemataformans TaxID=61305 RepID=UPI003EC14697
MTATPLSEVRNRMSDTKHGEAVAVLVAPGALEALEETFDVLTSPSLLLQLGESRAALEAGDALDADELAALMARRKSRA